MSEKISPTLQNALAKSQQEGHDLHNRLETHLAFLRARSLVDVKVTVSIGGVLLGGRNTTTQSLATALTNALTLYRQGKYQTLNLDALAM